MAELVLEEEMNFYETVYWIAVDFFEMSGSVLSAKPFVFGACWVTTWVCLSVMVVKCRA